MVQFRMEITFSQLDEKVELNLTYWQISFSKNVLK